MAIRLTLATGGTNVTVSAGQLNGLTLDANTTSGIVIPSSAFSWHDDERISGTFTQAAPAQILEVGQAVGTTGLTLHKIEDSQFGPR